MAVVRKQAMARAASSGVAVRRLLCSRVRLREARIRLMIIQQNRELW